MDERKRKRLDELEAAAEQDRKAEERERQHAAELLDLLLVGAADEIVDSIIPLAEPLAELDRISTDNPASPMGGFSSPARRSPPSRPRTPDGSTPTDPS